MHGEISMSNEKELESMVVASPLFIEAPKSSGRPVGSKGTKKIMPDQLHQAKTLYVAGKSIPEIGKILGLSSNNVLYRHMEQENWGEEREVFIKTTAENQLSAILTSNLTETNEILTDLRTIREKAITAIDAGDVEPRKYSEASQAYIDSVNASTKIRAEALQLSFLVEISKILRNRIKDPKLLVEISEDLRALFKVRQKEINNAK